jgi:hypothetical protein
MSKCKWVVRGVSARAHPFGCIIQRFRKLLLYISCSIYLTLSISFSFFFFNFFFLRCFSLLVPPSPETPFFYMYSFSFPGPSLLCWGFARISRCITVVIACRDCLQLSERMSVCLCTTLAVSLSFILVIVFCRVFFFFFFGLFLLLPSRRLFVVLQQPGEWRRRRRTDGAINMLIALFKRLLFSIQRFYRLRYYIVHGTLMGKKRNYIYKWNRKSVQPQGLYSLCFSENVCWKTGLARSPKSHPSSSVDGGDKREKGRKQETGKTKHKKIENFLRHNATLFQVKHQTSWSSPNFNL